MFDFAWSELALIGVVALVAIGPKDMPVAIKSIAKLVKKARHMAGEFQTHVDDLMKEADLSEMQSHLSGLRSFNLRQTVERAIDPDGSLRGTMAGQPPAPGAASTEQVADFVGARPEHTIRDPSAAPGSRCRRPITSAPPWTIPPPGYLPKRSPWNARCAPHPPGCPPKTPSAALPQQTSEPDPTCRPPTTPSTTRRCRCSPTWSNCGAA
jgi:sec-independent protein translocase protein TatB